MLRSKNRRPRPDAVLEFERRGNRAGADLWELYGPHRRRMTDAILAAGQGGRLCLLGAGNCNDVGLDELARHFTQIHLVDIDGEALARAAAAVNPTTRDRLRLHAGVDLAGGLRRRFRSPMEIEAAIGPAVETLRELLPAEQDLVVSCCVLSQLSWQITQAGDEWALMRQNALLAIHLRTLAALSAPERPALLITDVASSETAALDGARDLTQLLDHLVDTRGVFPCADVVFIKRMLRRDRQLAARFSALNVGAPWLWSALGGVTYLVAPLTLRPATHSSRS